MKYIYWIVGLIVAYIVSINKVLFSKSYLTLNRQFRKLWYAHVSLTREYIILAGNNLKKEDVLSSLLNNQNDIGKVFGMYYGKEVGEKVADLLRTHIIIAGNLVSAVMNNDKNVNNINNEWYENANQISLALNSINNYWGVSDLKKMLYSHLDMTKEEVMKILAKQDSIPIYDKIVDEAMEMADTFTDGIKGSII